MKLLTFKTIRNNLTFWFLILALVPLLIGILVTYNKEKRTIELETFDKLTAIRDLKVQQLENWLTERKADLVIASADYELIILEEINFKEEKDQNDFLEYQNIRKILNRFLKNYTSYTEIFIINPQTGIVELSTNIDSEGIDKSDNIYFTKTMETREFFIKDIYYSEEIAENEMTFSIPIFCKIHDPGHIIGIMVARIDLDNSLYALLSDRVGLGKTGETLIVNKDVMALNELRTYDNAPLNLQISSEPAVNAVEGKTGIVKAMDYRGEEVLAAYTFIPQTGWGFICKQDMSELNAPIRGLIINFIVLFIVSALLIVLIVFWISKRISKPVVDMNIVAQKITGGDYSVRNVVHSDDELGSLADSTNKTLDHLESLIATQKGSMDIFETMVGKSSMEEFGTTLLKQLMQITEANMGAFYILNEETSEFEHFTSVGANTKLLKSFNAENPEGEFGNVFAKKSIYYLRNIPENTIFKFRTTAGDLIPKEIITIPIMIEETVVALISLVNIHSFSKECFDIIKQSWRSINSSYSSLLGNERTRILAEHLSKTNLQLEAQTEELQEQSEELQAQTEELQNQTEELQRSSEELQEQNLELEVQRKQVEEANRLKSEFLSNMSHELRTPLNSIMSLSRVLIMQTKDKLSEEENDYLEIVERNGKQLLSLINDILDLSKIEAGKVDLNPEFIFLNTLLGNIKDSFMPIVQEKDLELKLDIKADLPEIETDEAKLHQVLQNIISNSIKFTEKGNIDIQVNFDSEKVYINIKDTGIGIPQDELSYIFDEFRQVDGSSSRQYQGTGLGLAIVYKLTKILNGDIDVKSKPGEGSAFTITLPIKWQGEVGMHNMKIINPEISVPNGKKKSETRLLIVEDNEATILQIKAVLEKEEYIVDVTNGGKQALEYIKHTITDGIILDLMMPEMDGFEVLENIRSTEETRNIPVLILTAKDLTREDLSKLSVNSIHQLIQKGDVDIDGLLVKVKMMLGNDPGLKTKDEGEKVNGRKSEDMKKRMEGKKKRNKDTDLPNILIVEDNPDNMTTIKAIIKDKYSVLEAFDGKQGLKVAISELPDAILLDMALPEMDGIEVVRILKNNEETRKIPVIAVTAHAMKEDKEKFLAAGCDGYIAKPIDPEALLKEISNLIIL